MNQEQPETCDTCGVEWHKTAEHKPYYHDTGPQRLAWLEGWQAEACDMSGFGPTDALLPFFDAGVEAARKAA